MNGIRKEYGYPVLTVGDVTMVKDEKKAEILAETFSM